MYRADMLTALSSPLVKLAVDYPYVKVCSPVHIRPFSIFRKWYFYAKITEGAIPKRMEVLVLYSVSRICH